MEKEIETNLNNNDSSDENEYKEIMTVEIDGFKMRALSTGKNKVDYKDWLYLNIQNIYC